MTDRRLRSGVIAVGPLVLSVVALITPPVCADHVRALLIGNSYTNHTWPALQGFVDADTESTITLGLATMGGTTLAWHFENRTEDVYGGESLQDLLASETWDVVVMQEHSLGATSLGDTAAFFQAVQDLTAMIETEAPGAQIRLFETWARRSDNTKVYPDPFPDPESMQAEIRANYATAADPVAGIVDPVGDAWELASQMRPYDPGERNSFTLHESDTSHPNVNGEYLSGALLYERLFGRVSVGSSYLFGGMTADDALFLQQIATWTSGVCPGDVTGDAIVDIGDLLAVSGRWGLEGGLEDVNDDGVVDTVDLLLILSWWGSCP